LSASQDTPAITRGSVRLSNSMNNKGRGRKRVNNDEFING